MSANWSLHSFERMTARSRLTVGWKDCARSRLPKSWPSCEEISVWVMLVTSQPATLWPSANARLTCGVLDIMQLNRPQGAEFHWATIVCLDAAHTLGGL